MVLTLIRGLPGSGKSTLASQMVAVGDADIHLETDLWFTSQAGEYRFDPDRLSQNHAACLEATKIALKNGLRTIVSNTFTRLWEMKPYLDLGFPVRVIEATGSWPNVHGVPEATIENMRARWEPYGGARSND